MSRAGCAVLFPDGTVKWALYNGTCDMLVPRLFDDSKTPWDAYYQRDGLKLDLAPDPEGKPEPVIIYVDYGDPGFWWEGHATRNVITSSVEPPDEAFDDAHDGAPAWVRWE